MWMMLGRCPGPQGPGWVIGRTFGPQENVPEQSLDQSTPIRSAPRKSLPALGGTGGGFELPVSSAFFLGNPLYIHCETSSHDPVPDTVTV